MKNVSNVSFSSKDVDLMGRGLKYCIKLKLRKDDVLGFAVEIDVAIESVSRDFNIINHIRNDVFMEICKATGGA